MKPIMYKGWQDLQTLQSKEILSELVLSKESQRASVLISDTGLGKSNTIRLFRQKLPKHTYVVTVGHTYSLNDVINELNKQLGITREYSINMKRKKLELISERLEEMCKDNGKPIIILDEAENLKLSVLKTVKELYDAIIDYCSIVLIGTGQIIDLLVKKHKQGQSVPQLYRRFKAGIRYISPIKKSRDFKPFFDLYVPDNPDVQDLLLSLCDNYGELHDFLHPVLQHCSKKGEPLTEQLFRYFHKLPSVSQLKAS